MGHLRFVSVDLIVLAGILGLATFGASPTADAAPAKTTIARPTHLRPVQSKADCATVLSLLAVICDAAVKGGDLQLIWDGSDKTATGYNVYQVDRIGGHKLVGTTTARYYVIKKPREGYANLCFAVAATAGKQTSPESARYCYAPDGTATTRSIKPSRTVTQVTWSAPAGLTCSAPFKGPSPLPGSAFFQAADKNYGSAFTVLFRWLTNEQPTSGRVGVGDLYAGSETASLPVRNIGDPLPCAGSNDNRSATVQVTALSGVQFDLRELAKHKLYSAALTLKSSQTLDIAPSGHFRLSNGGWCPTSVGAANREWRIAPLGNLTYGKSGLVTVGSQPRGSIDVSAIVSGWQSFKYRTNYGFIVANPLPPHLTYKTATAACLTKFSTPSLETVYF